MAAICLVVTMLPTGLVAYAGESDLAVQTILEKTDDSPVEDQDEDPAEDPPITNEEEEIEEDLDEIEEDEDQEDKLDEIEEPVVVPNGAGGAGHNYDSHSGYTYIVSVATGKALRVSNTAAGEAVTADADIPENIDDMYNTSLFKVLSDENRDEYKLFRSIRWNQVLKAGESHVFIDGNIDKPGGWEGFSVKENDDGTVSLYNDYLNIYLTIDEANNNILKRGGATVDGDAEKFHVVEGLGDETIKAPAEPQKPSGDIYIIHKGTGNLVTVSGVANDPILATEEHVSDDRDEIPYNAQFELLEGKYDVKHVVNFKAQGTTWFANGAGAHQIAPQVGGWESVTIVPLGGGFAALRENQSNNYLTVNADGELAPTTSKNVTDNEKFSFHTKAYTPEEVVNLEALDTETEADSISLSWKKVEKGLHTGYEVWYKAETDTEYTLAGSTGENNYVVEGLTVDTEYEFKIHTVIGEDSPFTESDVLTHSTLEGFRPEAVEKISIESTDQGLELAWTEGEHATGYDIYHSISRFGIYEKINDEPIDALTYTHTDCNEEKFSNNYKIMAINKVGESDFSPIASLEINMFGENMIIFSPEDDLKEIEKEVQRVYLIQKDAQFGEERYSLYFRPGDYSKTTTPFFQIGFYTQIAGLGKTPLDTKISNIMIPAYLPGNNATCNFWRSAENLTISSGGQSFTWAVSQAAPLRRMNIERKSQFDWSYGNASGGYAADTLFKEEAGSYPQQQFYIRDSEMQDAFYGVNWNGFFQGVVGDPLEGQHDANGFASNWIQGAGNNNYTSIKTTPVVKEKPFLYVDDNGDYKVFVPSLKKDSSGISWSEDNMGPGTTLDLLEDFYIAKEDVDTGATINAALAAGKHVFLTPGIYYAEEPIRVNNENAILLGTGMATIIPTNSETAVSVGDVDGVTIAGVILDAGSYSESMIEVGSAKDNIDRSANPTLLSDVFIRVGGTTDALTKADYGMIINSNDVIGDHFWIWRADHGAGVAWDGNESINGLIVNGDDVVLYALFNEHFQEYQTLWNGERGRTYFYQCELPYDPQHQSDWMSHDGTVKGYAAYKVANKVRDHYVVGLGIYNVLINTNGESVFLDNAIEVPHRPGVLVENACIVELSDANGPVVGINSIVNGTGKGVSTGGGRNGFAREYILRFEDGIKSGPGLQEEGEAPVNAPDDVPEGLLGDLYELYDECYYIPGDAYTTNSWNDFIEVMEECEKILEESDLTDEEITKAQEKLQQAKDNLLIKGDVVLLELLVDSFGSKFKETDYSSVLWSEYQDAVDVAEALVADRNNADVDSIADAIGLLNEAVENLIGNGLNKASLEAYIKVGEKLIASGKYTSSSTLALRNAVDKAIEIVKTSREQADFDNGVEEILSAIDKLQTSSKSSGGSSSGSSGGGSGSYTFVEREGSSSNLLISSLSNAHWINSEQGLQLTNTAKAAGNRSVSHNASTIVGIKAEALAHMAGMSFRHDTLKGKAVDVRVTVAQPTLVGKDIMVSGSTYSNEANQTKARFNKWFGNEINVVDLHQSGSFGAKVRVAVKVKDVKTVEGLFFYVYNPTTNTYKQITGTNPFLDNNGYLHFSTFEGGRIVISQGKLTKN